MDHKFHPAIRAIKSGDLDKLRSLVKQDPSLATARSSTSHPTLLQCVVLEAANLPNKVQMAQVLIDAGAEINGPLLAAASIDNAESAQALLDAGAAINEAGSWSPLEEALYWGNQHVIDLLVTRGASVHNLRIAAGLGRIDLIETFFDSDGHLKPEAGKIDWPFGDLRSVEQPSSVEDPQHIINNAFVYACANNHIEAAKLLLQKGAEIDAIPPGFDYAGTALHNAAVRGHRAMVEFLLEQGANPNLRDQKVHNTPAGWADYGGHKEIRDYLLERASAA